MQRRFDSKGKGAWAVGTGSLLALLLVFAFVVAGVTWSLRRDIRDQIKSRDAQVLALLIQNQIDQAEFERGFIFEFEGLSDTELWEILIETATAKGVFAVQLYSPDGELARTSSDEVEARGLEASRWQTVLAGEALSEYHEQTPFGQFVRGGTDAFDRFAVLELYLPLASSRMGQSLGVVRYLLDGAEIEASFALLDRRLRRQAGVAVGIGGLLIAGLFGAAWWRLSKANRSIMAQSRRLEKANAELASLARTSALGPVAAHLMHGLKNPLAGLQQVMQAGPSASGDLGDEEWRGAQEAARRMQRMVQEVVALLQDVNSETGYEISLDEIAGELERRMGEAAVARSLSFVCQSGAADTISSYRGNIVLLIASNLVQNSLEAARPGDRIEARIDRQEGHFRVCVLDTGPGIPEEMRDRLFSPVPSSKSGGAGIGLSICRQLALHLGGSLELKRSSAEGSCFELRFPVEDEL
ncbi:HAMP domain-containing sensor histidine kinase [Pelagicoccus sp. SDUM812003]|uniref:sensor histidine kinase n=1 Tax=Pelagicoccus sp. SDUM812003 TaxID=3041267 RepID=UPI00280EE70B|nr:HAMP domain-containing sensor histidine kinase [Pelagicoccus sp. SDUM812003]MDQ8204794.1 HAMP domain-containing sensor histidine kinase [Pelagicoccus sp. SDUM812003]